MKKVGAEQWTKGCQLWRGEEGKGKEWNKSEMGDKVNGECMEHRKERYDWGV